MTTVTEELRVERARLRRLKRQLAGRQKLTLKIENLVRSIRGCEIRIATLAGE